MKRYNCRSMPKINAPTIDEHKVLTRNALLEGGFEAFVRFGLVGTSIGTLADIAGIARTTVYEYFPNKESVLAALIEQRLPPIVAQVVRDLPEDSPTDRISEILRRAVQKLANGNFLATLSDRGQVQEITRKGRVVWEFWNPQVKRWPKPERDAAWSVFDVVRDEVARTCRKGINSGEFPQLDPVSLGTIVADHLVGGIDELSVRGRGEAETVAASRIAFLRQGLRSPGRH